MSQTETLMLFFLGFCAALLIILMFGRAAWSILGRWSGWQQKRQVPVAIRELQADRDSLKAEKAIMARKLESGVSDMKMRLAEQMAEVSRNRNRVLDLTAKLAAAQNEIAELNTASRGQGAQITALSVQIEENVKAINTAWAKASENEAEATKLKQLQSHADNILTSKDQRILNLENEAKALRDIVHMFVPSQSGKEHQQPTKHGAMPSDMQSSFDRIAASAEVDFTSSQAAFSPQAAVYPAADNVHDGISASIDRPAAANVFQARFNNLGNPFESAEQDQPFERGAQSSFGSASKLSEDESSEITKGVSNVLSLAQRFRGLQNGVKK